MNQNQSLSVSLSICQRTSDSRTYPTEDIFIWSVTLKCASDILLFTYSLISNKCRKSTCVTGWKMTPSTLWLTSFENLPSRSYTTQHRKF